MTQIRNEFFRSEVVIDLRIRNVDYDLAAHTVHNVENFLANSEDSPAFIVSQGKREFQKNVRMTELAIGLSRLVVSSSNLNT